MKHIVASPSGVEEVEMSESESDRLLQIQKEWAAGADDRAWEELRQERNEKLQASDWTQSRDVTLSNDDEWKAYRSALRDLPETTDPANPDWPKEPST
tara:strand:+ start:15017 stop:15310 length:294 start_codon:yes stop_codon:yes gene_type:complete